MCEVSDRDNGIFRKSSRNPRGKYNDKGGENWQRVNISEYTV